MRPVLRTSGLDPFRTFATALAVAEVLLAHGADVHIRGADRTPLCHLKDMLKLRSCC